MLVMADYKQKIISYVKIKREKKITMYQDASNASQAFIGKMAQWQWWQSKHKNVSSVKKKFYQGSTLEVCIEPIGCLNNK